MTQYALDMSLPVAYAPEQFIVSESNRLAYEWVIRFPDWPGNALYVQGEHGAGKTHLAHLWQQKSKATFLVPDHQELPSAASIIDGVETWRDETTLFHLYNHCKSHQLPLLITSTHMPDALAFTLPDIRSRLKSLPLAHILPPDDALLAAVLRKHLSDRQLKISEETVHYIMPRAPRSFSGIAALVATLDNASLAEGRMLTVPFVRQFL